MLSKARLVFVLAVLAAVVVLVTEFPLGELVTARSASSAAAAELSQVRQQNRALEALVHDLKKGSTIEQIAHEEYGLVEPGQRSYVVMPSAASTGGKAGPEAATPLGSSTIPRSDLVPSDSSLSPGPGAAKDPEAGESFWRRLLNRLEFWKATV